MPRLLGIDYGARRIGLALTDVDGRTAFGYTTLDARKSDAMREISRIVDEEMVKGIVLGLPLRSDNGEPGEVAKAVLAFAEQLRKRFPRLPLHLEDERFTSYAAEESLKAGGWVPGKDSKAEIDKAAAKVLLQDYLDRTARGESSLLSPPSPTLPPESP